MKKNVFRLLQLLVLLPILTQAQVWSPDNGDGTYKNPIIYADYSDPDLVRVGNDIYMTASSFSHVPGLPILHSTDMVNWELINYALPRIEDASFDAPRHGDGVWAPSFRYHDGWFYIFYGDPDFGIYYVKTKNPREKWEKPVLVKKAYGNIDPCPLWDEDGKVYMVHAFAHSRAGIKSVLQVVELKPDLSGILDKGTLVFDGHANHETVEGPKFYKRNGYYYIFAPAGGVPTGWQLILRSKNIRGPYEEKIVLAQGSTTINGPHQGGLIELENGESWFVHFQDVDAYGRIPHLQPVRWVDDWPVMGNAPEGTFKGEPVMTYKKPTAAGGHDSRIVVPATTDEFDSEKMGLQWQWQCNYQDSWFSLTDKKGTLRLNAIRNTTQPDNLWFNGNLYLQKFAAPEFMATTKLSLAAKEDGARAGLTILGLHWASINLEKTANGLALQYRTGNTKTANEAKKEFSVSVKDPEVYLQVKVTKGGICNFFYSTDGKKYKQLGDAFTAQPGKWVGAKVGIFCTNPLKGNSASYADFDWFRVEPIK